jgi:hypothetical protein
LKSRENRRCREIVKEKIDNLLAFQSVYCTLMDI